MILVAATALGLWLAKVNYDGKIGPPRLDVHFTYWIFRGPPTILIAVWAATLIVLRLQRPRPDRKRLVRQPGFVACVAILAGLSYGGIATAWFELIQARWRLVDRATYWRDAWEPTSAFVVGAWISLRLAGRGSASRDWFDRAGRFLGWFCVAHSLLSIFAPMLPEWLEL